MFALRALFSIHPSVSPQKLHFPVCHSARPSFTPLVRLSLRSSLSFRESVASCLLPVPLTFPSTAVCPLFPSQLVPSDNVNRPERMRTQCKRCGSNAIICQGRRRPRATPGSPASLSIYWGHSFFFSSFVASTLLSRASCLASRTFFSRYFAQSTPHALLIIQPVVMLCFIRY